MTNESNEPEERYLTFPNKATEIDTFFKDVPRRTMGDGGQYIENMGRKPIESLFTGAAAAKSPLAKRLGLDADGRRWFEMPAADLSKVSTATASAVNELRWFVDSLLDIARGYNRGHLSDEHIPSIKRLEAELGVPNYVPFYSSVVNLMSLLRSPATFGDQAEYLSLLRELPTSVPDAEGKRRTIRTAKWLKKYAKLVAASAVAPLVDIDVLLSRIQDELAKAKQLICISANPLDFLLSATRQVCDFTSCHSLDGMHAHGNSSYALDGHTFLVFVAPNNDAYPFFKTGRAWLYLGPDDQIILGQAYGRGVSVSLASYVVRQVEQALRPNEVWRVRHEVRYPYNRLSNIGHREDYGHMRYAGYFDLATTRIAVPRSLLASPPLTVGDEEDEVVVEQRFRRIVDVLPDLEFKDGICLSCGHTIDRDDEDNRLESPLCHECHPDDEDYFSCGSCGGRHANEDAYTHDGEAYCESCFQDTFIRCDYCNDTCSADDSFTVYSRQRRYDQAYYNREQQWCEYCTDHHAHRCECCGDLWTSSSAFTVIRTADNEAVCYDCRDDVTECPDCGEITLNAPCPDAEDHAAEAAAEADAVALDRLDNESPAVPVAATAQEVTHA